MINMIINILSDGLPNQQYSLTFEDYVEYDMAIKIPKSTIYISLLHLLVAANHRQVKLS